MNVQDFEKDFLLREYQETHNYFNNVEGSMADLLKFYNSVLAIVTPISALLFRFLTERLFHTFLGALALVIFLLGLYILAMYLELRIRKIKTLEQIAVFRERMIEANHELGGLLKMITAIRLCPPYLRRPSSEWYTVIYISSVNGLLAGCSVWCFLESVVQFSRIPVAWWGVLLSALLVAGLVWYGLFRWATGYCYVYDLKREKEYSVKNEYSFLDPSPYFPWPFSVAKRIAESHESKLRAKYHSKARRSQASNRMEDCEFCRCLREKRGIIAENEYWFAKWDKYPVAEGHALVIPKNHSVSLFELSEDEILSLHQMISRAKATVIERYRPDGFNVGVNIGEYAGQTIQHLHVHLIPRYQGDVADPEGGVRNIIPGKGKPGS